MKKKFLRQPHLGISLLFMLHTRTFIVAPRILNVRHFGEEILPQEIFFRRDLMVTLFSEDFEVYLFLTEKVLTV